MNPSPSPARRWLSTMPVLLILLFTVLQGTAESVHAQLLKYGEKVWPGYASLRVDPSPPTCDVASFDAMAAPNTPGDDLLDDLFDEAPQEDAKPAANPEDALLDDLFEEAPPAEAEVPADDAPTQADEDALLDDLFEEAPEAEEDDLLDGLMEDDEDALLDGLMEDDEDALLDGLMDPPSKATAAHSRGPAAAAIQAAKKACEEEHAAYAAHQDRLTPGVKGYRSLEQTIAAFTDLGRESARYALVFLVLVCATTASATGEHIALQPIRTQRDNLLSYGAQLLANLLALASCLLHYQVTSEAGVDNHFATLPLLWGAGFVAMSALCLKHLLRPGDLTPGGSLRGALSTVPLYTWMALIAFTWFVLSEGHPTGLAIYLDKLAEHAGLYIQVGLYVWAGMLLKRTQIAPRFFDILRPWKMPPELLAAVVVVLAAIPTAYSGASGIFVIAVGALIYQELRKAGGRNQLALAATAMSGSLGVVLAPCLLVVIVASLNKQVTTTELFSAGRWVFLLTAGLFAALVLWTRQSPLTVAPASEAAPKSLSFAKKLLPYFVIGGLTLLAYALVLNTWINEHNAPRILLVALLVALLWEKRRGESPTASPVVEGTAETTGHIGALLTLMALSVAIGGVIERADVLSLFPADLGSPLMTMGLLTVLLVLIGMVMDPYGAVILVSATLAQVAYANGIDPLHFWMVVLVAFELGYLTPPVALNHLLTRAVVGDEAEEDDVPQGASLWRRHEKILLPVTVLSVALVLVAFGPLLLA